MSKPPPPPSENKAASHKIAQALLPVFLFGVPMKIKTEFQVSSMFKAQGIGT